VENAAEASFCSKCGQSLSMSSACRNCGNVPKPGDVFCQKCGANLSGPQAYQTPGPPCPHCGQANAWGAFRCVRCGKKMNAGEDYTNVAGILMILAGLLDILSMAFMSVVMTGGAWNQMMPYVGMMGFFLIVMMVFGIIAILAGYYSMKRQHFLFCIIGAVVSAIGVGSLIGVIAAVLVLISKDAYEN
jgi:uncharacterized protein (DUF983 family)